MLSPTDPTAPETGFPAGAGAGAGAGVGGALGFGLVCAERAIGAMRRAYSQRDRIPNSTGCVARQPPPPNNRIIRDARLGVVCAASANASANSGAVRYR